MFDYTEFDKLIAMAEKAGWTYQVYPLWGGKQIILYKQGQRINDAIIHSFSYGHDQGLLETWEADNQDEVIGCLTAEQVYDIWVKDMAEA